MPYIEVPIETDPTDLAEEAFGYIEEQVPGWLPSPGNLEAWLIEALALLAGELRDLAALVPDAIFQYFGSTILDLPPFEATAATSTATWTAIDTAGYTVDAGTLVVIEPPASTEAYAFAAVSTFTIPAGQTNVSGIPIQATEAGAAASGITGTVEVIDPLDFIASVALEAPTQGGSDAESTDAYLDRLSDLLTLLSPRPILPQDFAVLVQRSFPEVARATAIDLYNAQTATANVPRCVTVVCVDAAGNPVSAQVKADADALLQAEREVNFLAFIADPTYTTIDVQFTVMAYPGYDAADVAARVIAELQAYLSPASWGLPPYGDTSGRSWINDTKVRYLELTQVVNDVEGVHYVVTLQSRIAGGTYGTTDLSLTGVAPLPKPGSVTGTATVEA
jgi:hypothetical protein